MHADQPTWIESKANPWFKQLRQTALDNARYKSSGLIWVEGDHLVHAALQRGLQSDGPYFIEVMTSLQVTLPQAT